MEYFVYAKNTMQINFWRSQSLASPHFAVIRFGSLYFRRRPMLKSVAQTEPLFIAS